jgi:bifunctional ADP-heptose synthase (sugar kinase/adenylyltransferase)
LIDIIAQADVMVKGSDYQGQSIIGEAVCPIIFFERIDDYSTTKKIQHTVAWGHLH